MPRSSDSTFYSLTYSRKTTSSKPQLCISIVRLAPTIPILPSVYTHPCNNRIASPPKNQSRMRGNKEKEILLQSISGSGISTQRRKSRHGTSISEGRRAAAAARAPLIEFEREQKRRLAPFSGGGLGIPSETEAREGERETKPRTEGDAAVAASVRAHPHPRDGRPHSQRLAASRWNTSSSPSAVSFGPSHRQQVIPSLPSRARAYFLTAVFLALAAKRAVILAATAMT